MLGCIKKNISDILFHAAFDTIESTNIKNGILFCKLFVSISPNPLIIAHKFGPLAKSDVIKMIKI